MSEALTQSHYSLMEVFLLRTYKISSIKLCRALSTDRPFLNMNYSYARILLEFKQFITLLYITFYQNVVKWQQFYTGMNANVQLIHEVRLTLPCLMIV
jgi:hypothetical protein